MVLLNYFVTQKAQQDFDLHVKKMIRDDLMQEGDPLWAKIRKLYLNTWVYDLGS